MTKMLLAKKCFDFLSQFDAYDIPDTRILTDIDDVKINFKKGVAVISSDEKKFILPLYTPDEMQKKILERGKGGFVNQGKILLIDMLELASGLCLLCDVDNSQITEGRGSTWRIFLERLETASKI
jgi:hypothetical protein